MNNLIKKLLGIILAIFALSVCFAVSSSAASEWTYADKLPSGITSKKYVIQYKHTYRTTAKSAPGSDWENKGFSHTGYENSGSPYWSTIELATSETRALVGHYYYHWCGSSMGNNANFCQSGGYVHYDWISASEVYVVASHTDSDNSAYKYYALKFNNGNWAYCQSGVSCDGSNGSHGARSYYWYRNSQYQDKVAVAMYTYEKESKWEDKKDDDAVEYRVRYKLKHEHKYPSEWKVSKKATFNENGTKYKVCKTCGYKNKVTIRKVSNVKLAKTTFTYNGKVKTPTVTVKDSKGNKLSSSKYKVTYSTATGIGKHKVTVTLDSKYYKSSKTLTYKINPAKVTGVNATPGKNSVTLKWNASGGGVSYRIYTYNKSTKKTDYIKTVSGTSCTLSSLKSSKVYRYVIKGYKVVNGNKYYSDKSKVVSCQPYGRPTDIKNVRISSKTDSSVTIRWDEAKGNNVRYYIFRYDKNTGKYTSIGKTNSLKYTVKDLKADTTYRFAVQACSVEGGVAYFSTVSPVLKVKTYKKLVAPKVDGVQLSTEGKLYNVLVTWNAKSTATGYKVYRSTSGKSGTYKKIATITDPTVSSYTDTTVSAAKKYYYKVRSYRTRGKQTVQSDYSSRKSIVTYSAWTENLTRDDLYFGFYNWSGDFGYPDGYVVPLYSYQLIYGNTELANQMYNNYNSFGAWGGSCHGMCATSAMMNIRTSGLTPAVFNASAQKVYQLAPSNTGSLGIPLFRIIEAMQVTQIDSIISYGRVWNDMDSLMTEIMKIKQTGKPVIIGVRNNGSGHALLAYDYYWVDSTTINVKVYDPNYKAKDRNFTLYLDSQGYLIGWYYSINDKTNCGTYYEGSDLEYLTYDIYSSIWTNSVSANNTVRSQTNTLIVNSQDIDIYNGDNELVATLRDGVMSGNDESIAIASPTDITVTEDTPSIIYLPSNDTYTVVNTDSELELFEATMVNIDRSADISTEADAVTFTVNDGQEINLVSVEADEGESYNIVLSSSEDVEEENLEVIGNGNGSTVSTAQTDGRTELINCVEADVYVGEDGVALTREEKLELK